VLPQLDLRGPTSKDKIREVMDMMWMEKDTEEEDEG